MQSRSAQLLIRCASAFERSKQCQFITDASQGTLTTATWQRYICHELSFVHSVQHLMEQLIEAAPSQDKRAWSVIIANLRDEQTPYLAGLLTNDGKTDAASWGDDILSHHVASVTANGGYYAFAVSMCAAENLYQQWCYEAWRAQLTQGNPQLHEWIGMHVNATFHDSVAFWNNAVNRMDKRIQDATLQQWCEAMLDAEGDFHDSAYRELSSSASTCE